MRAIIYGESDKQQSAAVMIGLSSLGQHCNTILKASQKRPAAFQSPFVSTKVSHPCFPRSSGGLAEAIVG